MQKDKMIFVLFKSAPRRKFVKSKIEKEVKDDEVKKIQKDKMIFLLSRGATERKYENTLFHPYRNKSRYI